jgi:hypothetical protein
VLISGQVLFFQFWQLPDFGNFGDLQPRHFSTFVANKALPQFDAWVSLA